MPTTEDVIQARIEHYPGDKLLEMLNEGLAEGLRFQGVEYFVGHARNAYGNIQADIGIRMVGTPVNGEPLVGMAIIEQPYDMSAPETTVAVQKAVRACVEQLRAKIGVPCS